MIRVSQLLLVLTAGGLWVASQLPWVSIQSFDGLGQPRTSTLNGAAWATALPALAVLLLAAALAGLAIRGWLLRLVAVLVAVVSVGLGYIGIGLIAIPDVAPRAAALADVPVSTLVASQRYLPGAVVTLVAAVGALVAAVLLMRSAVSAAGTAAKYAGRGQAGGVGTAAVLSERGIWDALDEGHDPTDTGAVAPGSADSDTEGR